MNGVAVLNDVVCINGGVVGELTLAVEGTSLVLEGVAVLKDAISSNGDLVGEVVMCFGGVVVAGVAMATATFKLGGMMAAEALMVVEAVIVAGDDMGLSEDDSTAAARTFSMRPSVALTSTRALVGSQ